MLHRIAVPVGARIARPQLVDISKLGLNNKIKKFIYSFICRKGYSPPFGGRIAFCLHYQFTFFPPPLQAPVFFGLSKKA